MFLSPLHPLIPSPLLLSIRNQPLTLSRERSQKTGFLFFADLLIMCIPSVSGSDAGKDLQDAHGSSRDSSPRGHGKLTEGRERSGSSTRGG